MTMLLPWGMTMLLRDISLSTFAGRFISETTDNAFIKARMGKNVRKNLFLRPIMCVLSRWAGNPQPRIFNYFAKRTITIGRDKHLGSFALETTLCQWIVRSSRTMTRRQDDLFLVFFFSSLQYTRYL